MTTASGLYLSSPLMMLVIASGRSAGSSPLILGNEEGRCDVLFVSKVAKPRKHCSGVHFLCREPQRYWASEIYLIREASSPSDYVMSP